jgi:hypothetical protein
MKTKRPIQTGTIIMNDIICSDIFDNENTRETLEPNLTLD